MIFRVYNQNGKVKITKVCRDNVERPMFSSVPDGEFVEIETEVTQCSRSMKKKIGQAEETQTESSDKAVRVLEFAIRSGIDYEDEAKLQYPCWMAPLMRRAPQRHGRLSGTGNFSGHRSAIRCLAT